MCYHGTWRLDSEPPGSKSERGMMTNDKASLPSSVQSERCSRCFISKVNFTPRALIRGQGEQKFNVNGRAKAGVESQELGPEEEGERAPVKCLRQLPGGGSQSPAVGGFKATSRLGSNEG